METNHQGVSKYILLVKKKYIIKKHMMLHSGNTQIILSYKFI